MNQVNSGIMAKASSAAFHDSKPHYALLDGLRGVAALLVVWYHVHEGFAFASGAAVVGGINHGYMAVDFFFILSGFVIGYAYDDRWKRGFTLKDFFKRRLVRLHPMIVMGAAIGAVTFAIGGCQQWDGTRTATSMVMLALLCAMFFIPAVPGVSGYELRGNGEMFPLNGPSWSLFFEYIGNILYALLIRRLSTRALAVLTVLLGVTLAALAMGDVAGYGNFGVGWTLDGVNFGGGLVRMMFPFAMGMLLSRRFRPWRVRGAFWICSVALIAIMAVPYIGSSGVVSMNGVYESVCILVVFPAIVWIAASGVTTDARSTLICKWLGDISFPLYAIHYPFMYLFYQWLIGTRQYTLGETWPVVAALFAGCLAVAWLCLKLYDEPVRRWLARKFITPGKKT